MNESTSFKLMSGQPSILSFFGKKPSAAGKKPAASAAGLVGPSGVVKAHGKRAADSTDSARIQKKQAVSPTLPGSSRIMGGGPDQHTTPPFSQPMSAVAKTVAADEAHSSARESKAASFSKLATPVPQPAGRASLSAARAASPTAVEVDLNAFVHHGVTISVVHGDITSARVGAIVNPANGGLQHSGGVARAISKKGGHVIQAESDAYTRRNGSVPTGGACVTSGGNLPSDFVVHAVGPIYNRCANHNDACRLLRRTAASALREADGAGCASIALPAISSGIFGFPKDHCARQLFRAVVSYVEAHTLRRPGGGGVDGRPVSTLTDVRFVVLDVPTLTPFRDFESKTNDN